MNHIIKNNLILTGFIFSLFSDLVQSNTTEEVLTLIDFYHGRNKLPEYVTSVKNFLED